ncbi:hypothetical protein GOODEAATRI_006621, partial [Goodea atripinnis]
VSVTLENFQDISLPIPGKEDLAKLHSASHQTSLVKAGSCGEAYAPQGWIAFVMEYIKRFVWNKCTGFTGTPHYTFVVLSFLHVLQHPLSSSVSLLFPMFTVTGKGRIREVLLEKDETKPKLCNIAKSVPPNKASCIDDLVVMLPQNVWDHLYSRCMLSADCTRFHTAHLQCVLPCGVFILSVRLPAPLSAGTEGDLLSTTCTVATRARSR